MRRDDMERLHERFLGDLPVARDHLADMHRLPALLRLPAGEVRRQHAQVLGERCRVRVHVQEYEATPAFHARLRQREIGIVQVREIPAAGHRIDLAVELPAKAVERTAELRQVRRLRQQLATSVRAGVVVGAKRVRRGAHDDERLADDVVDLRVTDGRDVFLAAGHLPDARPQPLRLQIEERLRGVALRIQRRGTEVTPDLLVEERRHGDRIRAQVVAVLRYSGRNVRVAANGHRPRFTRSRSTARVRVGP